MVSRHPDLSGSTRLGRAVGDCFVAAHPMGSFRLCCLLLLRRCSSVFEELHQRFLESVHCLDCFLGLLGLLKPWPAVLGVREFARVSPLASALPVLTAGLTAVPGVALSFAFAPAPTAAPASALAALASTVPAVALLGFFGRPRHQSEAAIARWAGYHAVLRQVRRFLRR